MTLTVRLPEDIDKRLSVLAEQTGRPKSYYVRQAIEEFLEDQEDYLLAVQRLEKSGRRLSMDEVEEKLLGLED